MSAVYGTFRRGTIGTESNEEVFQQGVCALAWTYLNMARTRPVCLEHSLNMKQSRNLKTSVCVSTTRDTDPSVRFTLLIMLPALETAANDQECTK